MNWLFNVTINDISVIYVTAHRCAGGLKLDLRLGSQRNRHLGTVHLIFWGGGWDILEKKFLALILTKKNKLAQWHSEKNNLSPIV